MKHNIYAVQFISSVSMFLDYYWNNLKENLNNGGCRNNLTSHYNIKTE